VKCAKFKILCQTKFESLTLFFSYSGWAKGKARTLLLGYTLLVATKKPAQPIISSSDIQFNEMLQEAKASARQRQQLIVMCFTIAVKSVRIPWKKARKNKNIDVLYRTSDSSALSSSIPSRITLHLENPETYFQTKMHHPVSTHQDKTVELEFAFLPESIVFIDWYLSSKISL
jgi:hypothetical protein